MSVDTLGNELSDGLLYVCETFLLVDI